MTGNQHVLPQDRGHNRVGNPLQIHLEVADALADGRPVVALETSIVSHGLPQPQNLEVGRAIEAAVRHEGAVPATTAVLAGRLYVGLTDEQLIHMATASDIMKLSARDLAMAIASNADGATTVAATLALADTAGISVMATGGLGGVHRGARDTWDISGDLVALSRFPLALVAAGVKSILDTDATLEYLETLGVPVVGWRTRHFPGFYLTDSGAKIDWAVHDIDAAAALVRAQRFPPCKGGVLLANPIAPEHQLDPALHAAALHDALEQLAHEGVRGKAATPYLLAAVERATAGGSVEANRRLVLSNARLAAQLAVALAS